MHVMISAYNHATPPSASHEQASPGMEKVAPAMMAALVSASLQCVVPGTCMAVRRHFAPPMHVRCRTHLCVRTPRVHVLQQWQAGRRQQRCPPAGPSRARNVAGMFFGSLLRPCSLGRSSPAAA